MNLDEIVTNDKIDAQSATSTSSTPPPAQQPQVVAVEPTVVETTGQVAAPATVNPYQVQQMPLQPNINVNVDREKIEITWIEAKKVRVNWFFRWLNILALLWVWVLMLLESMDVLNLRFESFNISGLYAIIVILSVIVMVSRKWLLSKILWLILFLTVIGGLSAITIYHSLTPATSNQFEDKLAFDLHDGNKADLRFNTYVWDFKIKWSKIPVLLEWQYIADRGYHFSTGISQNNIPYMYFQESSDRNVIQKLKSNLNIKLSQNKSFDLYLKNFVWNYDLDFVWLDFDHATMHGGIWDLRMILWQSVNNWSLIEIRSAWSDIEIDIPKNIWVQLYYKQLMWTIELSNFVKSETEKNYFESLNIDTASKVIKIDANIGIGKLKINWID